MSIGTSGRIVIEIDPETKRALYSTLARDGLSLKDWFLHQAHRHLEAKRVAKNAECGYVRRQQ